MRAFATVMAGVAILLAGAATAQDEGLDPVPIVIHGVVFGPQQTFEGGYTNDHQTSRFHPIGVPPDQTDWLVGWQDRPGDGGGLLRRYHIRFVGRRTVSPGQYGSLGKYANEVMIDRLISARVLIGAGG